MADNIILMKDLHFDKLSDIYKTMQDKVKDKKDVKVKNTSYLSVLAWQLTVFN